MKKTGINLLAVFVCIGFLTGCNLFGPSKKDVEQALDAVFRAFEDSTTQNEPEYTNRYTNAADAIFRNEDESLIHELSLLIDEGKVSVTGNCVMTEYEDSISQYILSGELAYEVTYSESKGGRDGIGSMTGELSMAGGKLQFIDFSFIMAENGALEEFEISADGKNIDFADDQNPYSLFKALSDRLPG
jgi:hypothetical protein